MFMSLGKPGCEKTDDQYLFLVCETLIIIIIPVGLFRCWVQVSCFETSVRLELCRDYATFCRHNRYNVIQKFVEYSCYVVLLSLVVLQCYVIEQCFLICT